MEGPVYLYDTLTRQKLPLTRRPGAIHFGFYCCGPTVYAPAHIGNFRTFILQDVLRRVMTLAGLNPFHVRNLTDVDDKTMHGAQQSGLSLRQFTQVWTDRFRQDCHALGLLDPHQEPCATDHIPEMLRMIQLLLEKGHAYATADGCVYFRVGAFPSYGRLSGVVPESLLTQGCSSSGHANLVDEYQREQVADFALWKAYKPQDGQQFWESPWGRGRPGWHIECSAMSLKYLAPEIDLHGGGVDLCFPHHENEIAQSEAAMGRPFCRHWFHSAHLQVEGQKMSKSLGNLYTVEEITQRGFSPRVLRYALLAGHYRHPLNFTFEGLHAARSALAKLARFHEALQEQCGGLESGKFQGGTIPLLFEDPASENLPLLSDWGPWQGVWQALCDDLNTPQALGSVFSVIAQLKPEQLSVSEAQRVLEGLYQVYFALGIAPKESSSATVGGQAPDSAVQALAQQRWQAKGERRFDEADRLRAQLEGLGWQVIDHKDHFQLQKTDG